MQTRCDLFGHQFSLWKEGGQSYMRCDYCPAVREITAADLRPSHIQESPVGRAEMAPIPWTEMADIAEKLRYAQRFRKK